MTAELDDGSEIKGVEEVVEGSHGVHLKKEVKSNNIERVAYIPYPNLVYSLSRPSASGLDPEGEGRKLR